MRCVKTLYTSDRCLSYHRVGALSWGSRGSLSFMTRSFSSNAVLLSPTTFMIPKGPNRFWSSFCEGRVISILRRFNHTSRDGHEASESDA